VYLERTGTLITGDALTSEAGQLRPPNERATPDLWAAGQSVGKLAGLDVQAIVTYHGGVVCEDASGQLKRVAAELAGGREEGG
jgi:glyoxylase-like metal-dependent hydrolase (beta-lactamase superfamily II)